MIRLKPNLEILPASQRKLWSDLAEVPSHFVLYGGTAIALRLAHRQSVDFDFFSSNEFRVDELAARISFLADGERLQSAPNTLSVSINRDGPVKLSFFGGLKLARVGQPECTDDHVLHVASLLDLAATKMVVIQQRAEKRDYLDIHAILNAGITLPRCLGAAQAVYGDQFNPAITLKALAYFRDGDLPELPREIQEHLAGEATAITSIPVIQPAADRLSP